MIILAFAFPIVSRVSSAAKAEGQRREDEEERAARCLSRGDTAATGPDWRFRLAQDPSSDGHGAYRSASRGKQGKAWDLRALERFHACSTRVLERELLLEQLRSEDAGRIISGSVTEA